MTAITPAGAIIPGVTHHQADVNGTQLYYVPAGTSGFPVLLVHGWPGDLAGLPQERKAERQDVQVVHRDEAGSAV